RPARPLARVAPLFERCRALLDRWTLSAPVSAVRVAIAAAAPLTGEQGDLLSASWRDIGAADAALERLRAELGPNAIVRAVHQGTQRPEKAGVWRDALEVETIVRTRDVPRNDSPGAGPSTALGMTPVAIPSERSESRDLHSRATDRPRALRVVREPAPPPATTAAHRALEPAEPVEGECEGEVPRVVTWRG